MRSNSQFVNVLINDITMSLLNYRLSNEIAIIFNLLVTQFLREELGDAYIVLIILDLKKFVLPLISL